MQTITRRALYDMVRAEPVRTVAQRFNISDVAFKKYCSRAAVPVPERGYWAKLAAGKKVAKIPLPPREPGASNEVHIGRPSYAWGDWKPEAELAKPPPEEPVFHEPLEDVRTRVARRAGRLKAARDLSTSWAGLRKHLEEDQRRAERQRTERWPSPWDKPLFESGFEKRRLKLLNSLAFGLQKAGARLEVKGRSARDLTVKVGDTALTLTLDHPAAKADRHGEWQAREGPADTLRLTIRPDRPRAPGYQAVWEDDGGGKLETRLTEMVIEIVTAGEAEHRAAVRAHYEWQLKRRADLEAEVCKRREEAERKARERRLAQEKARREHLFAQAQAWRTARDIRGFVAEVQASVGGNAELRQWADWALAEADALDPLRSGSLAAPHESGV